MAQGGFVSPCTVCVLTDVMPQRRRAAASVVWSYPFKPAGNPYTSLFCDALASGGWQVREYVLGATRTEQLPEVLHVHWPEQAFAGRGPLSSRVKRALFLRDLRQVRRSGGRVIWTAHNVVPHDGGRRVREAFRRFVDHVDGVVHLSKTGKAAVEATYPRIQGLPNVVVPHGDLAVAYRPPADQQSSRDRLGLPRGATVIAHFGRDRSYKGVATLVASFLGGESESAVLILAGYRRAVSHPRVIVLPGFLDSDTLVNVIAAADLLVFPFDKILHSGSVLLALGLQRPVLAPCLGSMRELQDEIGADWLRLYTPPLTPSTLEAAADWATRRREHAPCVSPLSWQEIAQHASSIYRAS